MGSNTPIGALVAGLNNPNVFSAVGRVYADGVGNLFASTGNTNPSSTTITPNINTLVGTYSVGSDCSIVMTLGDPFITNSTAGTNVAGNLGTVTNGVVNVGANSVTLEGELVQTSNSTEIYLVGTSRHMAGARVTLLKTSEAGSCSSASLFGNFGVVGDGVFSASAGGGVSGAGGLGTGTATGPTGTGTLSSADAFSSGAVGPLGTPFSLLGRFYADGAGNLVNDAPSATSTLKRNLTGTYSVNSDCSGTARLVDQAGVSRNIGFILANEFAACSAGGGVSSLSRQRLHFVFTDPGVIGSGTARLQ